MELAAHVPRPMIMNAPRIRRLVAAGMLTAALAGCGSVKAGAGTSPASTATTASTATGCASTSLATKVSIARVLHLVEPTHLGELALTQTDPAKVQALFQQFCQVITHPDGGTGKTISCPDDIGVAFKGTFYAGTRVLASYVYSASGCQVVTLTSAGKSQSAVVAGTAAAAAPALEPDMAKALGMTEAETFQPYGGSHIHPGSSAAN
jgi:hypothetical protein